MGASVYHHRDEIKLLFQTHPSVKSGLMLLGSVMAYIHYFKLV